jgi:hypothetical protein
MDEARLLAALLESGDLEELRQLAHVAPPRLAPACKVMKSIIKKCK